MFNWLYLCSQDDNVGVFEDEVELQEAVRREHDIQHHLQDLHTLVIVDVVVH